MTESSVSLCPVCLKGLYQVRQGVIPVIHLSLGLLDTQPIQLLAEFPEAFQFRKPPWAAHQSAPTQITLTVQPLPPAPEFTCLLHSLLSLIYGFCTTSTDKESSVIQEQLLSRSLKKGVLKGYPSNRTNCLVHTLTIKVSIKSIVLYYEVTQPMPFLFLLCPKDYTSRDDKSPGKAITNNLNTESFNTVFNKMNSFQ